MKLLLAAFSAIFLGVVLIFAVPTSARSSHLLGAKECTWGPSYWCSNITNAKNCKAVRHCIQTVWEKTTPPEDNDSICQICLDMVKQARDQLESNETQNDLKAVFEGSCNLIPLKIVKKECDKLVDDFIPELVEALASQMNPQMVCSVAGLCNNAAIDVMLDEYAKTTTTEAPRVAVPAVSNRLSCLGCYNISSEIASKFHKANRDDVLDNMLHLCGRLSSFSDACGNIVLTYFNDIYSTLKMGMDADGICHISGVCSANYHQHPEIVEIRPMSDVGVVPVRDDVPCELCEQLVTHLREVLIANTTEAEFKQVLEGLCKQTKGFKPECLSIVDQYYDVIYQSLVNDLDANGACFLIGICRKGSEAATASLLPSFPPAKIQVTIKELPKKKLLGEGEPELSSEEINAMQLPIDKLMGAPHPGVLVENGQLCTMCEYFMHFLQETLATPATEEKIEAAVKNTCSRLPNSISGQCKSFVDMYGDAVIALLIQGIDARQICPELKFCPQNTNYDDMEIFAPQPIDVSINSNSEQSDKPTCPLCLFAMQQAQTIIKGDKTKTNIKKVLDNLCNHLPQKLSAECVDFIETYSSELVQKLVDDFTPQEICVSIKLCEDNKPDLAELHITVNSENGDILTNEIPDFTVNGQPIPSYNTEHAATPECMLCEKVIKETEKRVVNKKSKEQIKHALEHACEKLPKIKTKCQAYIEKYEDKIISLIMLELTPKQICRELGYCILNDMEDLDIDEAVSIDFIAIPSDFTQTQVEAVGNDGPQCVICEFAMTKLEEDLKDKKTQAEIEKSVKNICKKMPATVAAKCNKFVEQYADIIIELVDTVPPKEICQKIQLCTAFNKAITDEVVECGICHGVAVALVPYLQEQNKQQIDPQEMIERSCETLPAKYYSKCSELIEYYGESIHNLVKYNTDVSHICARIGKCFQDETPAKSFVQLLESDNEKRPRRSDVLVGQNKCTYGPSHWCAHPDNAKECGTTEFCETKVWNKTPKAAST